MTRDELRILFTLLVCAIILWTSHRDKVKALERRVAAYKSATDELIREKVKWEVDALSLAHDDAYRGLHGTVILVEDKLDITPSRTLTVKERWEKLSGSIDARMLRLLKEEPTVAQNPHRERDATRMIKLQRLVEAADNEHERAAAQRVLDRLLERYA